MTAETIIRTGRKSIDDLVPRVRSFLERDVLEVVIDGGVIRGYRTPDTKSIWIRDTSDMMRGFRHFERDLTSVVEHFAETQGANGRIFDYFTTFPEKPPGERENWTKYVRVPVEADVEYRFVKAAFLAWQATGDDDWIRGLLPHLERAIGYTLEHPWRWEKGPGLVKRAYTIDTWDFAYTGGGTEWLQFQIDENTFWGFFHGDNSGTYEAMRILERLCARFGERERSHLWAGRAKALRAALNHFCFNGRFYTHFVKLDLVTIPGVDEAAQLSLSNPMAINRGAANHAMAASILREYQRRRATTDAFAEWFSIDPPFPDGVFGDEKLVGGAYVNGGIMPLVGGELARAAFEHGFETYGVDILLRYHDLIAKSGETYLWYFPDGTPASVETSTSPEAEPTDGWGSSAMLWALLEGLAGVVDRSSLFREVRLSPRFPAAGIEEAEVQVGYACSGASIGYAYRCRDDAIEIEVEADETRVSFHVLLPEGANLDSVSIGGRDAAARVVTIQRSRYVDFAAKVTGGATVRIALSRHD